jgi:hypothetical protein
MIIHEGLLKIIWTSHLVLMRLRLVVGIVEVLRRVYLMVWIRCRYCLWLRPRRYAVGRI